ncbi:hypothetical protein [Bartonella sp. AD13SXNS]|uniref:hypothetical protein n=1 Tax=Bartonella sp. AD13SXNS TaxID=3243462 RepID=UPI0035CED9E0
MKRFKKQVLVQPLRIGKVCGGVPFLLQKYTDAGAQCCDRPWRLRRFIRALLVLSYTNLIHTALPAFDVQENSFA